MQLRPEQLAGHLARTLAPLYVVHGDEPLLVMEAGDAIRKAARARGHDEREVLVAGPGFRWETLHFAAGNLSLFGAAKLIDLRIPNGKPGREGGEALTRHAQALPAGVVLLVTLPELDWAVRKQAWFTALAAAGTVLECNAPPLAELPRWLGARLAAQDQPANAAALEFIAARVEGNLLAAHQEIQKLALLYPPGALTLDQVRAAVLDVARYDVEDLRFALLAGDIGRCARLLDGLRAEGAALPLIVWVFANEIRTLGAVRNAMARGEAVQSALKSARVFDLARARAMQQALARLDADTLSGALQEAARLDRMSKGLESGDAWDTCLRLAETLCRRQRRESRIA